jgi:hypothetical protein
MIMTLAGTPSKGNQYKSKEIDKSRDRLSQGTSRLNFHCCGVLHVYSEKNLPDALCDGSNNQNR